MAAPSVTNIVHTGAWLYNAPVGEANPDETTVAYGAAWGGNWVRVGYTKAPLTMAYESEEADVAVSQAQQIVGRLGCALDVVHTDTAGLGVVDLAVDQHQGLVALCQFAQLLLGKPRAAQKKAIHSLCFQGLNGIGLSRDVLVRVAQKHVIVSLVCRVLDAAGDVGEKRVGDVRDDEADVLCAACGEAAGDAVGAIAHSLGDAQDALLGLWADLAFVVYCPRYGLWGDACLACNILDRNPAAHQPSPPHSP